MGDRALNIWPQDLRNFTQSVLRNVGIEQRFAEETAWALVEADRRGVFTHGVAGGSGLDDLLQRVEKGGINLAARPRLVEPQKYAAIAAIDADGAVGHSVAVTAARQAKALAAKFGAAKVYVYNSTHFGAAGVYADLIAEDGQFMGKVTCNSPAWMIPFSHSGRGKKRLGTNPIAWSIPYKGGCMTLDMATTQIAVSRAMLAAKNNQSTVDPVDIPPDYMVDERYDVITRPVTVQQLKSGSALPLGGRTFGYKGFGLALCVELDLIVGGAIGRPIPTGSRTAEGRVAQSFEAWALDAFGDSGETLTRITDAIASVRSHGASGGRLPGEAEAIQSVKSDNKGICYSTEQWERLDRIAHKINVELATRF